MAYTKDRSYDGYTFEEFSPQKFDKENLTDVEKEEMNILGTLASTNDIHDIFEVVDDDDEEKESEERDEDEEESEELKPEEFGLKPDTKMKNIYCDKLELYEEIRKYQKDNNPTDKLGEMLIKIALHMSTMARFWRYTHAIKQEIVEHAIYQMLISVPKFNLKDKKKNPFGYLSMICYRDMLHSLKKHFNQTKITQSAKEVYIRKLSDAAPGDERLSALRQLLERNEEFSTFSKNETKKSKGEKEVDMFALSRKDQIKYAKKSRKAK